MRQEMSRGLLLRPFRRPGTCSQTIVTATPDMEPPELDLNKLSLTATPSNPDAPNGETFVDIGYWVRDDISGLGKVAFRLRDPQGIEHHYYHYHDNFWRSDHTAAVDI